MFVSEICSDNYSSIGWKGSWAGTYLTFACWLRAFIAIAITLCLIIAGQGFYLYQQHLDVQTLSINYATLQEDYKALEQKLASLESEYNLLTSRYSALQSEHDSLVSEYFSLVSKHDSLKREHTSLQSEYSALQSKYNTLQSSYQDLESQYDIIFSEASSGYIASTIVYYTDYGNKQHIVTIFIDYSTFEYYKEKYHPPFDSDPVDYVTESETVIISIVDRIKEYTRGEEELADALLSFVQDQQISLSIRYYTPESRTSRESKYSVETLVEMGGDCKGHTILYSSLLKAAGYKTIILITSDHTHSMVGVHLTHTPSHGTQDIWFMEHQNEKYYFAETTSYGWMVGDLPDDLQNQTFYVYPVD